MYIGVSGSLWVFMGFRMSIEGDVSYEEPPLRSSRYRRFKVLRGYGCLWVFMGDMGFCRCTGLDGSI